MIVVCDVLLRLHDKLRQFQNWGLSGSKAIKVTAAASHGVLCGPTISHKNNPRGVTRS
jgi:hypothetical protein